MNNNIESQSCTEVVTMDKEYPKTKFQLYQAIPRDYITNYYDKIENILSPNTLKNNDTELPYILEAEDDIKCTRILKYNKYKI